MESGDKQGDAHLYYWSSRNRAGDFYSHFVSPRLEWSWIPAKERVSGPSAKGNSRGSKPSTLSCRWLRKKQLSLQIHNEDKVATSYWLTLKLMWLLVKGKIVKSNLWEKDHSPSRVISGAAPTPVVQLRNHGELFGMSGKSWTWSAVNLAEYWQLTAEGGGNYHDLARYAQLSMSAVSCEWCSFILGCGLVLFCAFQFSVKQLNSPSSCGDDSSHLLASYTSKTIEKMSLLILGDSHFKTMKQFFLSPEHHHVALVCHLSCSHTHRWCSFGLSQWGSL